MIKTKLFSILTRSEKLNIFLLSLFKCVSFLALTASIYLLSQLFLKHGDFALTELIALLVLIVSAAGLQLVSAYFVQVVASSVKTRIRLDFFGKLIALKDPKIAENPTKYTQLLTEGVDHLEIYFTKFVPSFVVAFFSIVLLSLLYFLAGNYFAGGIFLFFIPLIPLAMALSHRKARKTFKKNWQIYLDLGEAYTDNLKGLRELRLANSEEIAETKLKENAKAFKVQTMRVLKMQLKSLFIMDFVTYFSAALVLFLEVVLPLILRKQGIYFYRFELLNFQTAFLCLTAPAFFVPLRQLGSAFHAAMAGISAYENLKQVYLVAESKENKPENIEFFEQVKCFEFKAIDFKHQDTKIFSSFSYKFTNPNFYLIKGKSGCGKTTFAELGAKILSPQSGSICLNNTDILNISDSSFYKKLVYISAEQPLYGETVKEFFENHGVSDLNLVKEMLVHFDLKELSENLDYPINASENNLSGGEKQRLYLALVALIERDVYILDEITANLDKINEEKALSMLSKKAKQALVILISHRVSAEIQNSVVLDFEKQEGGSSCISAYF